MMGTCSITSNMAHGPRPKEGPGPGSKAQKQNVVKERSLSIFIGSCRLWNYTKMSKCVEKVANKATAPAIEFSIEFLYKWSIEFELRNGVAPAIEFEFSIKFESGNGVNNHF